MAEKKKAQPRKSLRQRLEDAASRGYSAGYTEGARNTKLTLAREDMEMKRLELAEKILRDFGQTWESVAHALRAVVGAF